MGKPKLPLLFGGEKLGNFLLSDWVGSYSSDYGHISGWSAPNEGGAIWKQWLQDADWCDETAIGDVNSLAMISTINGISGVLDAPFVNKNVMHSNRMRLDLRQ